MMPAIVSTTKQPVLVNCSGKGCKRDHKTYDVTDILLVMESMKLAEIRQHPSYAPETEYEGIEKKLIVMDEERIYPTLLGYWYDETNMN